MIVIDIEYDKYKKELQSMFRAFISD
jgi:hypothetical protein